MSGSLGMNPLVLYNWDPATQLAGYLAAKAAVAAGTPGAIVKIVALGDSTTVGVGDSFTSTAFRSGPSYPNDLVVDLKADGLPAQSDNFLGGLAGQDARVTLLGDATYSGVSVPGSLAIGTNSAGSGFEFTLSAPATYNLLDVNYVDVGTGSFTVTVDGGAPVTVQLHDTQQIVTQAIALPLGLHSEVTAVSATSTPVYLAGAAFENTAAAAIQVYNAGSQGVTSTVVNQEAIINGVGYPAVGQIPGVAELSPTLTLIDYGINDINNGTITPAQTAADIAQVVTTVRAAGSDAVIIIPEPFQSPDYAAELPELRADLYAVSDALNVPVIDLSATYGNSVAATIAAGLMADALHPAAAFYADFATDYAQLLTAGAMATETLNVTASTLVLPTGGVLNLTGAGNAVTAGYYALLNVVGDGNQVVASQGDTVNLAGANAVVTSTGAIGVNLQGSGASITAGGGSVGIQSGTSEAITLSNGVVALAANTSALLTGAGDGVTTGYDAYLQVIGDGETIAASQGDTMAVAGNNAVITSADAIGVNLRGNGASITAGSGAVSVGSGTGEAITLSNGVVALADGTGAVLTGSGNAVTAGLYVLVNLVGNGNQIAASAGDTVNVAGNNAVVSSTDAIAVNIEGYGASVTEGAGTVQVHIGTGEQIAMSGGTVTLQAATGATVSGAGDSISLGAGASVAVNGVGNLVHGAAQGLGSAAIDAISVGGSANMVFLGSGPAQVADASSGLTLVVSGSQGLAVADVVTGFGAARGGVVDLTNGAGGFASALAAVAALQSDGQGGTALSLGATRIDFTGVAPTAFGVANFHIG